MPGVRLMWVDSPDIASSAKPGQFVMITCDSGSGHLLRRPISIHQVNEHRVAFLFSAVGNGTTWLAQRAEGEKVDLLGPMGNGFKIAPESRKLLMIAGGMGIAPLCFLASEGLKKGCSLKVLAGARTACQICPPQFIPTGTDFITATEDGTAGQKGLITSFLPQYSQWADQVFICGPLPMYKAMARLNPFRGKPVEVSLETRMGCGLGFCYACTIKTHQGLKQVCKDGPVFDMSNLIWDEL
jgi:dihydroorotate dehydrogenase electron transfer subunit